MFLALCSPVGQTSPAHRSRPVSLPKSRRAICRQIELCIPLRLQHPTRHSRGTESLEEASSCVAAARIGHISHHVQLVVVFPPQQAEARAGFGWCRLRRGSSLDALGCSLCLPVAVDVLSFPDSSTAKQKHREWRSAWTKNNRRGGSEGGRRGTVVRPTLLLEQAVPPPLHQQFHNKKNRQTTIHSLIMAYAPVGKQRPVDLRVIRGRMEDPDFRGLVAGAAGEHRLGHGEGVEQEAELAVSLQQQPTQQTSARAMLARRRRGMERGVTTAKGAMRVAAILEE